MMDIEKKRQEIDDARNALINRQRCNANQVCEEWENRQNCPMDCPPENTPTASFLQAYGINQNLQLLTAILLGAVCLIGIYFWKRK